jgi:hypothetical protein
MSNFHSTWQIIFESEIKRKPEADRLWSNVPLPQEGNQLRHLHYALESKTILGMPKWGFCEVGCGYWIEFYFFDGVGYGYCGKCRVDQTIDNR